MVKNIILIVLGICLSLVAARPGKPTEEIVLDSLTERDGIPVHGNWCGPGHSGASESTACVDSVDCACKAHDLCYGDKGYLNCKCDNDFVKALQGNSHAVAIAAVAYFSGSPCMAPVSTPYVKTCKKCTKILGKKICVSYPCGAGIRCSMTLVLVGKGLVTSYKC